MSDVTHAGGGPTDFFAAFTKLAPEPPFHHPDELTAVWGRRWGAVDEVGVLKDVLVRAPGAELEQIGHAGHDAYNEAAEAFVDPDGGWYWAGAELPDLDRVADEHAGLVGALEREGVTVHHAPALPSRFTKAVYTRDPLVMLDGGAVIGRMAPVMRRGEEADVTKVVAALGIPILRTITGTGILEGGTVVKLRDGVVAFGTSIRCNEDGARQLAQVLEPTGGEVVVVPMTGYSIHLDGHLAIVDEDLALVDADGLPHWFLDRLRALGYELVHVARGEEWGVNCLALRPRRILINDESPRTAERLAARGVEVVTTPYGEIQRNGGGIHCSTQELSREPAAPRPLGAREA